MNYKKIGIIVADKDEYLPFVSGIKCIDYKGCFNMPGIEFNSGGTKITAVCCGIGKVNAATAAAHLASIKCDLLLNFGLSGGISGVKKGEFCLPAHFLEHDFDLTGIGYKPCEKPGQEYIYKADERVLNAFAEKTQAIRVNTAVSGDSFICDSKKREELKSAFSAACCDMETAAIASVCHAADIPFVALRRISDDAGEGASDTYRSVNLNEGSLLSEVFIDCLAAIGIKVEG